MVRVRSLQRQPNRQHQLRVRTLGEHKAHVRLTMDLIPDIRIVVYREGETNPVEEAAKAAAKAAEAAAQAAAAA